MSDNSKIKNNIDALMDGMSGYLSTKTVVGEPIKVGNNIIVPLADVSFGAGTGVFGSEGSAKSAGGMGAKISPSAVLVINSNGSKMVTVKNSDAISKLIDMVPDIVGKFTKGKDGSPIEGLDPEDIDKEVKL